jgi:hypothetical protein
MVETMPSSTRGADGKMRLIYRKYEFSSGYNDETTECIDLIPSEDGNAVLLVRTKELSTLNWVGETSQTYRISVDELIRLIEANGSRQ